PVEPVARRQLHTLADAFLRLRNGGPQIAAAYAVLQRHEALAVLAINVGGAGLELDLAEVAERDIGRRRLRIAARQRHRNRPDRLDIAAILRREADGECEIVFALIDACHFLPADRRLHDGVDVPDREAVARGPGAVDAHHEVRLAEQAEHARVG